MIGAFSKEELVHEVLVAPRQGILPLPDTQIIERPGWWQLVTPSLKNGGMNEVICSDVPNADEIIADTIAMYRERGIDFRITVSPDAKPTDLATKIERCGLRRTEALGMARSTQDVDPLAEPGVLAEPVSLANLDEFTQVMAAGWQMDVALADSIHRRMMADPSGRFQFFLARKDGVAGAAASYVALDRSAYFVGAVTLPTARGVGLYRALVNARLRHAASRNLMVATTLARAETSAPILKRLGFQTVFTAAVFTNA